MYPSLHLEPYRTLIRPTINPVCMPHFVHLSSYFPTLVNPPLYEQIHIVDNERRCSTSIISSAFPELAYAIHLSILFPLPILFLASLLSM